MPQEVVLTYKQVKFIFFTMVKSLWEFQLAECFHGNNINVNWRLN